ncbi:MAG TPA: UbiA family prenyltransferase [Chitinophagaceae bacterium]|nr:UbiA family prenyltransferase [Chitinophagaceae bacterium]
MLHRSTIQLLRFHFSIFLLPVYLFALSQVPEVDWADALLVFTVLHVLVYPSSNGYNSYMDRDTSPIGGLEKPLQPTRQLFYVTVIMDAAAIALGLVVSIYFAAGVALYILASRAYSYRGIRLKKYPVTGYLVVVIFQGALTFVLAYHGSSRGHSFNVPVWGVAAAACLIGGYYPLTQVYQHAEDKADGVTTISYVLGKRGTFIFCGLVFSIATACMFFLFNDKGNLWPFYLFLLCMGPMVWFFIQWMRKVWQHEQHASFRNSLVMNVLAAVCTTVCFIIMIINKAV